MKNVDESDDGAANGDDHVDNCENDADENADEHVDDGLSVEVHLLRHRPVEVGVHKDDRQLHREEIETF